VVEKDNTRMAGRFLSAAVASIAFRVFSFDGQAVRSRFLSKVVDRALRRWLGLPQEHSDDQ
jgi:hypothetical protein